MTENFDLKPLSEEGLEAAESRAEHYRLLSQPKLAQSICHDILAVNPDDQRALVTLVLAMSDEFSSGGASVNAARKQASRLTDEYQRNYYHGIISERNARALLTRGPGAGFAYEAFRDAMDLFEKAEQLRPPGNDDAILRWNACARTIAEHNLKPPTPDVEIGLE
jgi:hypothetical protein